MNKTRFDWTTRLALGALSLMAFGLTACGSSSIPMGDGGADSGIACGSATCTGGDVCCNSSCGICAPPGAGCAAIACVDGGLSDCGSESCAPGVACCVDCDGNPSCAGTEGSCPPLACPPPPPTCGGADSCGAGELCCDNPCDGTTFCTTAGSAGCPVFDCPPPPICGSATCAPGEACCSDCDGAQFCSAGACPAMPCPPPPTCGGLTCATGQICCLSASGAASCVSGPTCPGDPPPDSCAAQDARGEGLCDAIFGYAWNGSSCVAISGCSCVGADCGSIYLDPASCMAAHSSCTGATCGGFIGATCGRSEYCDYPASGVSCGAADGAGTCTTRPSGCSRVLDPVCGCDGVDYDNECIAHLNGADVGSFGTCAAPSRDCRTTGCAAGLSCFVCGPPGTGFSCVPDGTVCPL